MSPIRTGHHDRSCLTLMLLAALAGCTQDTGTPTAITLSAATVLTSGTPTILQADVLPPRTLASVIPSHHKRGPELRQAPETRPISAQGIRGDVLAQALRTETNRQGGHFPRFTQAMPWSESTSGSGPILPTFYVDQRILPAQDPQRGAYIYSTRSFTRGAQHNQEMLELKLRLWAVEAEGDASHQSPVDKDRPLASGLLQLGQYLDMALSPGLDQRAVRPGVSTRVAAPSVMTVRGNMLLTWDTPIQTWGNPDADHVELSVIPGRGEREFGLCLTARLDTVYRRQSCSLWQLPAEWQPGQGIAYQGHYLQETDATLSAAGTGASFETWRWLSPDSQIHVAVDAMSLPAITGTPLMAHRMAQGGR